jgi:hypothetical protein
VSIGGTVFRAWVLTVLWAWFAVSTFGVPPLSVAAVIGLTVIIRMLGVPAYKPETLTTFWELQIFSWSLSMIGLGVGYLIALFV